MSLWQKLNFFYYTILGSSKDHDFLHCVKTFTYSKRGDFSIISSKQLRPEINVFLYTLSSVRLIAQLLWDKKSSHRTEARELRPEDTDDRAPETRAPRKRPPRPCTGIRNFCTKYVAIESVF